MSPAMWTSSLLQTPGGAFEENRQPPATWSAASLKFWLSLIAGWSYHNLFRLRLRFGVSKLTCDQWWEPVYTLCLPLRLSSLYLSISVFTFSSSNNQSDGNCLRHWFNAVTFWENRSWAFKNKCVYLSVLHKVQFSSWMSHIMWIMKNISCNILLGFFYLDAHSKLVVWGIPNCWPRVKCPALSLCIRHLFRVLRGCRGFFRCKMFVSSTWSLFMIF